jgi:hypothetical protein
MPLRAVVHAEEVLAVTNARLILVADCYIKGVEDWTPTPWGWETVVNGTTIINVDHHAADERFYRHISSGNLAIEYRKSHAPDEATAVVINHTDCDSMISSALLLGLLQPEARYADAVIAADHTGEMNEIAELLQALDVSRDYGASLRNLRLLENGQPVEPHVTALLEDRRRERALASQLVGEGAFQSIGKVVVATLPSDQRISGEFLPPLLADAWVIVSGTPMAQGRLWETKVRLGLAAPPGFSLFKLGIAKAEPRFGGRWNAGSTKRAGGSPLTPREVAATLADLIEKLN